MLRYDGGLSLEGLKMTATRYRLGTHQSVAYTGTAGTISNAVSSNVIRVVSTTDAYVKVGVNPTATTSDPLLIAGSVEYFLASPGDKVSFLRLALDGTGHVTEMTTA